jgi:signal transduction histidine kinase
LGLAIVARLASSLGARVDLNSGPGEGSTFALILPIRPEIQAI